MPSPPWQNFMTFKTPVRLNLHGFRATWWLEKRNNDINDPYSNPGRICDSGLSLNRYYSIHVPGWLQKWLNLITAPGSVSNEPGSVTWLATKYLKTVTWRNHTVKLTTLWPQNVSFCPKINIPSSYFIILMLNCLQNTLQYDSSVTAVKFLT